jgi:hypothetical protein
MSELETDYLMVQLSLYTGIGKGTIAAFIVTEADKNKLHYAQQNNITNVPEIQDIIKRLDIKEKLENTSPNDDKKTRDFLKKVVLLDFKRKRELGTLKIHNTNYYLRQLVLAEFAKVTSHNFEILSAIGQNIIRFIKQKI